MRLSYWKFPSDTVTITFESRHVIICGDDNKALILPPFVLPSML